MSKDKLKDRSLSDLLATLELQAWHQGFSAGRDGHDLKAHDKFEIFLDKVKNEIIRRFYDQSSI